MPRNSTLQVLRGTSGLAALILWGGVGATANANPTQPSKQVVATGTTTRTAPAVDSTAGDIVVTAQRRSERLQDVPIAITALGSDELAHRGITDLASLRGAVPGLSIPGSAGLGVMSLAIRGITSQPQPIGAGQATAIYLDGVYLSNPSAAFFALDDVARIEVLRGPQGTLYGRNATAGAINIVTRQPGDKLEGGANISYGNFNSILVTSSLSGPVGGGFSAGVSGSYSRHDGYARNLVTGHRLDNSNGYTIRAKLRYKSYDGVFDATASADISHTTAKPYWRALYSSLAPNATYVGIGDPNTFSSDAPSEAFSALRLVSKGVALTMNYKASDALTLTSISSLRNFTDYEGYDLDGSAVRAVISSTDFSNHTFNQEIRAVATLKRFRATIGGNYFSETAHLLFPTLSAISQQPVNAAYDTSKLHTAAVFGQFEYDLTDRFTAVAGLRFNHESRDYSVAYTPSPPGVTTTGKSSANVLIPSIGLNFKATPNILLYAKAAEGYQAPGFNFAPGFPGGRVVAFGSESLWDYELGVHSQFLDRRITLNAAAFYYNYKNLQVRSVTAPGVTVVQNASGATVKGFEASLVARVTHQLSLGGQGLYLDARYTKFCQPISGGAPQGNDPLCSAGIADRTGNRLNQAPRWSGGVFSEYNVPIGTAGDISARLDYSWESNVYYSTVNEAPLSSGGWNRLDGRIGFKFKSGPEVYVFGRNLTDKRFLTFIARATATFAPAIINEPRTYGIGLRYRF